MALINIFWTWKLLKESKATESGLWLYQYSLLGWLVFMPTWQKLESFVKREPLLRKLWARGQVCCAFSSLITDADSATSGLVVLNTIQRQAEEAMERKPVSSTSSHGFCISSFLQVPAMSSCPTFPGWWTGYKMKQKLILVTVFHYSNRNPD